MKVLHSAYRQFEILHRHSDFSVSAWQRNPDHECKNINHVPLAQFANTGVPTQEQICKIEHRLCVKFEDNQKMLIELQLLPTMAWSISEQN